MFSTILFAFVHLSSFYRLHFFVKYVSFNSFIRLNIFPIMFAFSFILLYYSISFYIRIQVPDAYVAIVIDIFSSNAAQHLCFFQFVIYYIIHRRNTTLLIYNKLIVAYNIFRTCSSFCTTIFLLST